MQKRESLCSANPLFQTKCRATVLCDYLYNSNSFRSFLQALSSHSSALFSTHFTNSGTFPAMFCLMLTAFFTTRFTNLSANRTDLLCLRASHAHQLSRCITDSGTLHIQLYTTSHHFYIFFFCAGAGAVVTYGSAFQTCVYA